METQQLPKEILDKKSRERLEKFDSQWCEPCDKWGLEKLTLPDLKLLLQHFAPLQDMVRALVAAPAEASPGAPAPETRAQRAQTSEVQPAHSTTDSALAQAQAELAKAHGQCQALQHDLHACAAATEKLLQKNTAHEQASKQLKKELQQAQKELHASQAELARTGSAPMELALLREDTALAQALGLAPLPTDDTQALVQTVAVLAQRDNMERLWSTLKERCETDRRSASASESALLGAALAWHNHNWRTRPYLLIEAAPGKAYDYECHVRSCHTHTGETVVAQHLPGIADGSGTLLCKALVTTG